MYLGNKGYTILKSELGDKIHKVKRDLTAIIINKNQPNTSVSFYRESHKKMYLPRYYGISNFGVPENKLSEGDKISLTFSGSLRPLQENIVNSFFEKGANGLIEVGCGQGKTICALNIIQRLGKKTLVVVHKEFLLNQWIDKIKEFKLCTILKPKYYLLKNDK